MINSASDQTIGYHIFLEPVGTLAEELAQIIKKLATEYSGPIFAPHVTLLARIPEQGESELVAKCLMLAKQLSPLALTLGEIDQEDAFFKALYIKIKEEKKLEQFHLQAKNIFSIGDEITYVPHLSLLYGNYPKVAKEHIVSELVIPKGSTFIIDKMSLYKTGGKVDQWKKLQEFTLGA